MTFTDALFSATVPSTDNNGNPVVVAAGTPLTYTVSASYVDTEGNESRCLITNPTGSNPQANVTNVIVGLAANTTVPACQFTMSGSVAYSAPVGGPAAETGAMPGGLLLEVRDVQSNVKASYDVSAYGAFTIGGTTTPTLFSSNSTPSTTSRWPVSQLAEPASLAMVARFRSTGPAPYPTNVTDTAILANAAVGPVPGTRAWVLA